MRVTRLGAVIFAVLLVGSTTARAQPLDPVAERCPRMTERCGDPSQVDAMQMRYCMWDRDCVGLAQRRALYARLLTFPPSAHREDAFGTLLEAYGRGGAATRAELGPTLVAGGLVTRAGLALVPPYATLVRRVERVARARRLREILCEDDLAFLGEVRPGVVAFEASGNRCADGGFLGARVEIGRDGWRVEVEDRHTG